jgi:hypothetical protein
MRKPQAGKTKRNKEKDMKTTIEKILVAHGILEAFNTNEDYFVNNKMVI